VHGGDALPGHYARGGSGQRNRGGQGAEILEMKKGS
jgi:hypothetical protein